MEDYIPLIVLVAVIFLIYHLPFDQQLDTTRIDISKGECYAYTVKEAVEKGFRRAYKHIIIDS